MSYDEEVSFITLYKEYTKKYNSIPSWKFWKWFQRREAKANAMSALELHFKSKHSNI